jgi:hypothetical protein
MMLGGGGAEASQCGGRREHPVGQVRVEPDPLGFGGRQCTGLVPNRVGDTESAKVVDEGSAAEVGDIRGGPRHRSRRSRREFCDCSSVPQGVRGFEIGEVADGFEGGVEPGGRQGWAKRRFGVDDRVPRGGLIDVSKQSGGVGGDEVDERWVELRAATLFGHVHCGVHATCTVEEREHVGEVDDPRFDADLVASCAVGCALAVPPFECVEHSLANIARKTELSAEMISRERVVRQHGVGLTDTAGEKPERDLCAVRAVVAGADLAHHRPEGPNADGIDEAELGFEGEVVPEPLCLLVGVDVAAHPRNQRHVVQSGPVVVRQAKPVADSHRQDALADGMLHRLAHAEVCPQRQDGQQLREPNLLLRGAVGHPMSIGIA